LTEDELDFDADRRYALMCQAKAVVDAMHAYGEKGKPIDEAHHMLWELSIGVLADLKRKKDRKW
jgi:hypothetical protein